MGSFQARKTMPTESTTSSRDSHQASVTRVLGSAINKGCVNSRTTGKRTGDVDICVVTIVPI
ncbi:hypothetical protein LINGRAHAP2_LOCUS34843 [Linum grandiflorum]